jgi:hypothetical protein
MGIAWAEITVFSSPRALESPSRQWRIKRESKHKFDIAIGIREAYFANETLTCSIV